jgi:hypothetical protein
MAILIAVGAVVNYVIVFAHSNSTLELFELDSKNIAFISLYFYAGSILHNFLSISSTIS